VVKVLALLMMQNSKILKMTKTTVNLI
jgi:hypothetical protein